MVVRGLIKHTHGFIAACPPEAGHAPETEFEFKMRATKYFRLAGVLSGIISLATVCGYAQTAGQIEAAKGILAKVPAAQLAAKSAELVASAPVKERAAVAAAVGQVVAGINADLAPAAVTQISVRTPAVAPAAAAAAAGALPESAVAIATAAANVSDVRVSDIRTAVIAAVPSRAAAIVSALSQIRTGALLNQTPPKNAGLARVDSFSGSSGLEVF
jgi:hypothetical protein